MLQNLYKGQLYFYKRKLYTGPGVGGVNSTIFSEKTRSNSDLAYLPSGKHLVLALDDLVREESEGTLIDDYAYVRVLHIGDKGKKMVLRIIINSGFRVHDVFDGPLS